MKTFHKADLVSADEAGRFLEKSRTDTESQKGGAFIVSKAKNIISVYLKKYKVSGVCISSAGMIDCEKGEIFYSGELIPNYSGVNYKKEIKNTFSLPCEIENDVNCAGLAESKSGAAKDCKVALCLTIGTGIGGCILIDGKVFHGYSNSACEIGYMHMFDSDFQTLGASSILVKKTAELKGEDIKLWSGVKVMEQAKSGDVICIRAIDEMAAILGRGIANICYVINPEAVVLGGGIMAEKEFLRDKIEGSLKGHLKEIIAKNTRLEFAVHENDAGMLGAYYHFAGRHSGFMGK